MEEKNKVSAVILTLTGLIIGFLSLARILSDSLVVQAELYDSVVDLMYSVIIVSGFLLARRKRRPKYPEGLIRLEPIVASIVGIVVVGTGSYIIYTGLMRISNPSGASFSLLALMLIGVSGGLKAFLYIYVRRKSRMLDSSSLHATSVDLRNDVLTHIGAIVGFLSLLTPFEILEPIIGILIAGFILFSGFNLIKENLPNLLGFSIPESEKSKYRQAAISFNEVKGIHDFEVHFTGDYIDISMHLEVEGNLSVSKGHDIEISVADKLREVSSYKVNEINLHIDPKDLGEWKQDS